MEFDFDTVIDRRGTASSKWDKYAGRDVIPMWVADMDFRSPPPVLQALHARVEHGIFGYTHPSLELNDCVIEWLARQYDWAVRPQWLVWLPSLGVALNLICRTVGEPGDAVLNMVPVYPPFLTAPKRQDRESIIVPLAQADGRWVMDLDRLRAAITPRTRLLMLCSPHNPTGRAYGRAELEAVAELCLQHDLVLCSDEVHCGLVLDPDRRHIPTATLSEPLARRTVTFMAPSKTFNLPGMRCAFAVIPDKGLRAAFIQAKAGLVVGGNALGLAAAEAAYRRGEPWRRALIEYLRSNRDLVERSVADTPPLRMNHVEATYLAWIDVRALGLADPVGHFEAAGVGLSDGADFGTPGSVRLNFACPRSTLTEGLTRLRRAVREAR
jgi:cystathionine beta-lyase